MLDPRQLDYTNIDYESLREAMLDLAAESIPEWTDKSENDIGTALVELVAYAADVSLYYQTRIAQNLFPATADEAEPIAQLLRLIGYELHGAQAASTTLRLGFDPAVATPILIPAGTGFVVDLPNGAQLNYETVRDVEIQASDLSPVDPAQPDPADRTLRFYHPVTVVEGTTVGPELIGTSDGSPNQAFFLSQRFVLADSVEVFVNEPAGQTRWLEVETLARSGPGDRHFIVLCDTAGRAQVQFGDGFNGMLLEAGTLAMPVTVEVTYRTGGGVLGNVNRGTEFSATLPIVRRAVSIAAAAGGEDSEPIEKARMLAPRLFRANDNAVSRQDYKDLALSVPGVGKALAVAANWNHVVLYVAASGRIEQPSEVLRRDVLEYIEARRMLTAAVSVVGPLAADIYISARVQVKPFFAEADVRQIIEQAIAEYFAFDNVSFGQAMHVSRVYDAIQSLESVDSVFIDQFSRDSNGGVDSDGTIELDPRELPRLGYLENPPVPLPAVVALLELDGGVT